MRNASPSKTALLIACCVLILGGDEYGRRRLPPGLLECQLELLKAANLPFGSHPVIICNPIFAKLVRGVLGILFYPRILEGVAFRKLYVEEKVRNAISSQKIGQVLVIAGGYDTLAIRLSREFPDVKFFEVDHPATARVKNNALSTLSKPKNLMLIAADLTDCTLQQAAQDWNANCSDPDLSLSMSGMPSVVVVEGLLMYITKAQVIDLFQNIASLLPNSSVTCFDVLAWNHETNCVDMGKLASQSVHALVNRVGEPWHFGLASDRVRAFFQQHLPCWKVIDQQPRVGLENVACVELIKD